MKGRKSGIRKPRLIFGTGAISEGKIRDAIWAAGKSGYELIDTAWLYGNEKIVSEAVKSFNSTYPKKLKIITKIQPEFSKEIHRQLKKQLKAMGVEKVHAVLLHRPAFDIRNSVAAWKSLIKEKSEGLVERIGVSNFDRDMLVMLYGATGVWPEINQIELSVVNMREDRIAFCQKYGIEVQAWRPTGPYGVAAKLKSVTAIAKRKGVNPTQIALSYLLQNGVNPVIRSSSPEHVRANKKAEKITLSQKELNMLREENIYMTKSSETFDHSYSKKLYYDRAPQI